MDVMDDPGWPGSHGGARAGDRARGGSSSRRRRTGARMEDGVARWAGHCASLSHVVHRSALRGEGDWVGQDQSRWSRTPGEGTGPAAGPAAGPASTAGEVVRRAVPDGFPIQGGGPGKGSVSGRSRGAPPHEVGRRTTSSPLSPPIVIVAQRASVIELSRVVCDLRSPVYDRT